MKGHRTGHLEGARPLEPKDVIRATAAFLGITRPLHEQIPNGSGKMPNKYKEGTEKDAQIF